MKSILSLVLSLSLIAGSLSAQGKKGTPAEAEKMVKNAVAFFNANGQEKAFAEFSNLNGKFVQGDLYIFVYDMTGKCVAHGGNPKMVGKDLIDMKDPDGKSFVKERIEIAKSKGKGWQNYKFTNPVTKTIENKTAYIEKVGNFVVGCGAYK
jgi:cytochrome c